MTLQRLRTKRGLLIPQAIAMICERKPKSLALPQKGRFTVKHSTFIIYKMLAATKLHGRVKYENVKRNFPYST